MVLVTLGTQDKSFVRLLEAIENQVKLGNINDKIVVQAGCTKYESSNMEIFDLIPIKEMDELVNKCDILITHGGVGSIISGIKKNKVVIAAPRLEKYKEHTNDHQKQIIDSFSEMGYILKLDDELANIEEILNKAKKFKAKKFKSNTQNMIQMVREKINED